MEARDVVAIDPRVWVKLARHAVRGANAVAPFGVVQRGGQLESDVLNNGAQSRSQWNSGLLQQRHHVLIEPFAAQRAWRF